MTAEQRLEQLRRDVAEIADYLAEWHVLMRGVASEHEIAMMHGVAVRLHELARPRGRVRRAAERLSRRIDPRGVSR